MKDVKPLENTDGNQHSDTDGPTVKYGPWHIQSRFDDEEEWTYEKVPPIVRTESPTLFTNWSQVLTWILNQYPFLQDGAMEIRIGPPVDSVNEQGSKETLVAHLSSIANPTASTDATETGIGLSPCGCKERCYLETHVENPPQRECRKRGIHESV